MPHVSLRALSIALAFFLAACGSSVMQSQAPQPAYRDVKDNKPPLPTIRRNPKPTAYEITMTIENAPGPFAWVKGFMQYDTPQDDPCLPDLGGMAGTRLHLSESIPVEYEKIGEHTYRGVVYTDLLLDEDYYGLGVCRWSLIAARVQLMATGADGETSFFENIFHDDLVSRDRIKVYFNKAWYPRDQKIDNMRIPGEENLTFFKPEARENLFAIEFRIRKATP